MVANVTDPWAIKWLQNTDVDPGDIALKAKATLVEVRGRTMVLEAKGKVTPAIPVKKPVTRTVRETGKMRRAEKK